MEEEEEASVNSSSSSTKELYGIGSQLVKKRKSQYELNDPRSPSLKHKFRDRLTSFNHESLTTESLGCDGIFINKNGDMDMVNRVEEQDSGENTQSFLGGCIEVDSEKGIEKKSRKNIFWDQASTSSSSSNNISSNAFSSFDSTDTKQTNSLVQLRVETPIDPNHGDIKRLCNVLEACDELTTTRDWSDAAIEDEMLYSNGVDDFLLSSKCQNDGHDGRRAGPKKLTIDQEFEQYFSMLML